MNDMLYFLVWSCMRGVLAPVSAALLRKGGDAPSVLVQELLPESPAKQNTANAMAGSIVVPVRSEDSDGLGTEEESEKSEEADDAQETEDNGEEVDENRAEVEEKNKDDLTAMQVGKPSAAQVGKPPAAQVETDAASQGPKWDQTEDAGAEVKKVETAGEQGKKEAAKTTEGNNRLMIGGGLLLVLILFIQLH